MSVCVVVVCVVVNPLKLIKLYSSLVLHFLIGSPFELTSRRFCHSGVDTSS